MKKLMTLMALVMSMNSFAGIIVNKNTNEEIRLVQENKKVLVQSDVDSRLNGRLNVQSIKADEVDAELFENTKDLFTDLTDADEMFAVTFLVIPFVAFDAVTAPFKGGSAAIKNAKAKKDVQTINQAINSDEVLEVSEARFTRIKSELKSAIIY